MAEVTVIGRSARVSGRVTGTADVEILGHVEGDVAVTGDVTVDTHGTVGANVSGHRVTVRGAIKGDLTGEEAVLLESGAKVVGDVRAPRVAIAPGALVRGYVQTGAMNGAAPRARQAQASKPAARANARAEAPARAEKAPARPEPAKPAPRSAPQPAARPAQPAARVQPRPQAQQAPQAPQAKAPPPRAPQAKGQAKGPPPPVVPMLHKAKGTLNKKR